MVASATEVENTETKERDPTAYPFIEKMGYGSTRFAPLYAFAHDESGIDDPVNYVICEGAAFGDNESDTALGGGKNRMPSVYRRLMPGDIFQIKGGSELREVRADNRVKQEDYESFKKLYKVYGKLDVYVDGSQGRVLDDVKLQAVLATRGGMSFDVVKEAIQQTLTYKYGGYDKEGYKIPKGFRNKSGLMGVLTPLAKLRDPETGEHIVAERYRTYAENLKERDVWDILDRGKATCTKVKREVPVAFKDHRNNDRHRLEEMDVEIWSQDTLMRDQDGKVVNDASGNPIIKTIYVWSYDKPSYEKDGTEKEARKTNWVLAHSAESIKPTDIADNGVEVQWDDAAWHVPKAKCPVYDFSMRYNGDIYMGGKIGWIRGISRQRILGEDGNPIMGLSQEQVDMLQDLVSQGIHSPGYTRIFRGPEGGLVAKTWTSDTNYERRVYYGDRPKLHQPYRDEDGEWVAGNAKSKLINGKVGSWGPTQPLLDRTFSYNTREYMRLDEETGDGKFHNPGDSMRSVIRKPVNGEAILGTLPNGTNLYKMVSGLISTDASEARPIYRTDPADPSKTLRVNQPFHWRAWGDGDGTGFSLLVDPETEEYRERVVDNKIVNAVAWALTLGGMWNKVVGACTTPNHDRGLRDLTGDRDSGAPTGATLLSQIAYTTALQLNRERELKHLTGNRMGKNNYTLQQKEVRYAENAIAAGITDMGMGGLRLLFGGGVMAATMGIGAAIAIGLGFVAGAPLAAMIAATAIPLTGWIAPSFMAQSFTTKEDRELETNVHKKNLSYQSSVVGFFVKNPIKFFGDSVSQFSQGLKGSLYALGGGEKGKFFQVMGTAALAVAAVSTVAIGGFGLLALIPAGIMAAGAALTGTLTGINMVSGKHVFKAYMQRYWDGKPEKTGWLRDMEAKGTLGVTIEP